MPYRTVVLCILDGFGYREAVENNAVKLANTPTYDRLWSSVPRAWLETSGLAVGLPEGQMGNSEVGHMNLGSGRVVMQDLPKIDAAIADGSLARQSTLEAYITKLKATGGTAHVMGLLSPGGVHSHQDHMVALAAILAGAGIPVRIHAFLDGRDTPPRSAEAYLKDFEAKIAPLADTKIATVTGRYFAMDRDKRWDRVVQAYTAMVKGEAAFTAPAALDALASAYGRDENDEFVKATVIDGYQGMKDGDGLLMANFRADRARQIMTALVDPAFDGFNRGSLVKFGAVAGMTEYSVALSEFSPAIFASEALHNSLGEILAANGIPQLRIAETEKYAHVTFFFNGGSEAVFEGEDRILVPSPDVATYDLKPEMSAPEVTDRLVEAIESGKYGAIIVNYANGDMVGHTGILSAAIKAVEALDACLARLEAALKKVDGAMLVTADHGNCEDMLDEASGQAHTQHTTTAVPVLLVGRDVAIHDGALADVAPTMLSLMGLPQPAEMTGRNLVGTKAERASA